jgi:N-acetylmuramoyl-L-alanine amidase
MFVILAPEQFATLETYIKYNILRAPDLVILGHNQVQRKGCPSFDVPEYLKQIGVKDQNIATFKLYKQLY